MAKNSSVLHKHRQVRLHKKIFCQLTMHIIDGGKNYSFCIARNSSFFSSLEPFYSFNDHTILISTEQQSYPLEESNSTDIKSQ